MDERRTTKILRRKVLCDFSEWGMVLFENKISTLQKALGRCEPAAGMLIACAGCDKPILDKFLLNVLERTWHAECVRCFDCRAPLTDKCFSREGKLFCRSDFFSLKTLPIPTLTSSYTKRFEQRTFLRTVSV
ncbi:hypothetical protein NQ317_018226 [Molorchus minor]|uniref:LIM zinc-binding domain-containing protein n=1 Tax=Molorchus minor TaxID=1323400 RepID=A0ABQ9K573_9CUCU|nr:hypothetical protein NQ317_018226 [Molorchus minor]